MNRSQRGRSIKRSAASVAVRAAASMVALLLYLAGAPAFAQSTAVSWLLEGVVDPSSYLYTRKGGAGNLDGQAFSACARFDPLSAPNQSGDGTTYRAETSTTKPFIVVSIDFSGGLTVAIAKAGRAVQDYTTVYRDYPNPPNSQSIRLDVHHEILYPDGTYKGNLRFLWTQSISGVPASVMFADPNGGLSYSQPLNLLPEQWGEFNIVEMDKNSGTTLHLIGTFHLTSLKAVKSC